MSVRVHPAEAYRRIREARAAGEVPGAFRSVGLARADAVAVSDPDRRLSDGASIELFVASRLFDAYAWQAQRAPFDAWSLDAVDLATELFSSIGATPFWPNAFDPFFCELAGTCGGPHLQVLWPGFRVGRMVFARAGVRVPAAALAELGLAPSDTLLWASCRRGRRCIDPWNEWGSSSRWRSAFRRDVEVEDGCVLNADHDEPPESPEAEDVVRYRAPVTRRSAAYSGFSELWLVRCVVSGGRPSLGG